VCFVRVVRIWIWASKFLWYIFMILGFLSKNFMSIWGTSIYVIFTPNWLFVDFCCFRLINAWMGGILVFYKHGILKLIQLPIEELDIIRIHLCILHIWWLFLIQLILLFFSILIILVFILILITWLNLHLHLMRGQWVSWLHLN